jgi:hypothetical protein
MYDPALDDASGKPKADDRPVVAWLPATGLIYSSIDTTFVYCHRIDFFSRWRGFVTYGAFTGSSWWCFAKPSGSELGRPSLISRNAFPVKISHWANVFGPPDAAGWVNIKSRLPAEGSTVLVRRTSELTGVGRWVMGVGMKGQMPCWSVFVAPTFDNYGQCLTRHLPANHCEDVTHWMYLPAPPAA